ncbi:hypothetical protein AWH56_002770 [Anaerobacillus isosaccharinicus]|uniref:Uncharacterized protein n=2 Tax=Anaerobacillus isosaccharinicus TaxID=1532552 RepID=A0A7S7L903_9BACI|nr:hypothetical protein [Anaerobacillus isosaccharinicus]MBA5585033.1 hypothetical protein [Anaerobacillus isosaccharinicus]QOY36616.1 hypothetical protein AWH56_002770 [Anaerobacillus isosaccharinicus]
MAEDVVEHMDFENTEILYGPYSVDTVIMLSFDKTSLDISNVSGERIHINEIEVVIQENKDNDPFEFHMFIAGGGKYVIGYRLDYFKEEEALEKTKEIVYSITN